MRKQILFGLSMLSVFGCGVQDYPEAPGRDGRIVFAALQTRGMNESTVASVKAGGFEVAGVTQGVEYFVDKAEWSEADNYFCTEEAYYYPPGPVSFYASHPAGGRLRVDGGETLLDYESDGNTDLIVAEKKNVLASDSEVGLEFSHILSQLRVLWEGLDAEADYDVRKVELTAATSGTWNYASGSWTGLRSGSIPLDIGDAVSVIPSEMTLRICWDCLQNGVKVASYDKSVTFIPGMGKLCTVSCSLPNSDAQKIGFSIELAPWGTIGTNVSLSSAPVRGRVPVVFSAPGSNSRLDFFAFREDGSLDVHARQSGESLTARLAAGENLSFWLLANLPEGKLDRIESQDELLSSRFLLADYSEEAPLMAGSGVGAFSGASGRLVKADRAVCKVSLGKLTPSFLSKGLPAGSSVTLDKVYLVNAAVSVPVSLEPSAADLCNVGALDALLPSPLSAKLLRVPALTLSDASSKTLGMDFYCCPNPEGKTRLVLELTVCGIKNYYPVTLPPMQCNYEYCIADVELTGWGSASPDVPVDRERLCWNLSVLPWGQEGKTFVMN